MLFLIAVMILGGTGVYIFRFIVNGPAWAAYFSRANSGAGGEITDRYGEILARCDATSAVFSDDPETRAACYHVTGDYWDRTGTGLLRRVTGGPSSYDYVTGTTSSTPVNLPLNLDAELNRVALRAIGRDRKGAAMVMNYKTGEILCMASAPTVDPLDGQTIVPDGAFINRCLAATFTPGSSFKLVTAAAAIETVPNIESRSFYCEKEYDIAGVTITCSGTHYTQNFRQALANSCNIAFAQIAVKVGQDEMIRHVENYGFLDNLNLDGITTSAGKYPLDFVGDPELAWSGIGQSTDLVSPFAMLRFVAAIANYGTLVTPHLIEQNEPAESQQLMKADTASALRELMLNNVTAHYEPDRNFPGLALGAKTGTAELEGQTSHAWFVGFLDDPDHPYAFVVMIENGGGGLSVAGPVANQILQSAVLRS